MNLTTLEEVKEYLRTTGTPISTDFDDLIQLTIIPAISSGIEKFCSRIFGEGTYTEYHGGGVEVFYVKNPPIVSITSIYQDEDWEWLSDNLIDASEYMNFVNSVGYKSGKWPYAFRSIKIQYIGGYTYPMPVPPGSHIELPVDIRYAATLQAAYDFKRRKDLGLQTVSFPDGNIQKFEVGPLLSEVKGYLAPYDLTELTS